LSNTEWRPDGITTSSGRMHWNTSIFSNSEERQDDLPLRPDGCNLELFEASSHWWASGRKDLVVRTDVADWWASGQNTTSSERLTGNRNKSLKTSQNLLEEHSRRVDSGESSIPVKAATLHKSDFVKQNAANTKTNKLRDYNL